MEVELETTMDGNASSESASSGEGSDMENDFPTTTASSTVQARVVQADGGGSWTSGGGDGGGNASSMKPTLKKKKRASDYPVDCHVCRKTFQSRRSLVRHFRRFHAGAEFPKPQVVRLDEKGEVILVPSGAKEPSSLVEHQAQSQGARTPPPHPESTAESATMKRAGDSVDLSQSIKRQQADQPSSGMNSIPESAIDVPSVAETSVSPMLTPEEVTALKIFRLGQLCEALLIDVCLADTALSGSSKSLFSSSSLSSSSGIEGIAVFTPLQMQFLQASGYN